MTNLTIILAVIFVSIIVAINLWHEKPKRRNKGGRNNITNKSTNRRTQAKTDKKVRRGSK